jgi:tetratricopeptide (TPR) repeat protein
MLSRADIFLGHDDQAKAEAKRGLDLAGNLPRVQKMEIEASYFHAIADRAKAAEIYRVLFNLFPDSLDYGLQLAKLQLESYHPDEALETIRQLRQLPPPARDDPGIDLREASILLRRDAKAADPLIHAAARKAQAQGKRLIYAKAEQALCSTNRQHLQDPPECHEAYDAYLAAGNRDQAGSTLQIMAENQRLTGHEPEAIPLYEQAIRTLKEAGDRENVGVALNNLSLIYENQGRWSQAEQAYVEAKQDFMAVNDRVNTFVATANLGDISMMRGKFKMAAATYQQSWELADSLKSTHDEYAHIQHAALLLMQGNLDEAAAEAEAQANSLRSWGGDPWQLANAIGVSGDIEKARGNLANARKKYEESMEILKKANASVANSQLSLAELSVAEGHPAPAERMVREAITEFEKDKSAGEELNGYLSLCKALLAEGKVKESEEAIAHAAKLTDLHEFPVLRMPLQLLGARVKAAAARGDRQALAAAEKEMRDVLQKAHEIGFYTEECEARLALGELEMGMNSKSARSHLSALASDANSRGLGLIAHQAELSANRTAGVLAVSQPAP